MCGLIPTHEAGRAPRLIDTRFLFSRNVAGMSTTASWKCDHCGKAIGVYEPMMVIAHNEVRETSRAAMPGLVGASGLKYHRDCYLERAGSVQEVRRTA